MIRRTDTYTTDYISRAEAWTRPPEPVKKMYVVRLNISDDMQVSDAFCAVYATSALEAGKLANTKYATMDTVTDALDMDDYPEVELFFDAHGISNPWCNSLVYYP